MGFRDLLKYLDVSKNEIGLSDDADFEPPIPRQFFKDRTRYFEPPLRRLVRVGSCTYRDVFTWLDVVEFLSQQVRGMLLNEDFLFEVDAVSQLHKFVRVAGIAVFAGELAPAIRIDRPGERHARTSAAIEQGTDGEREIFDFVPLTKGFALRSQASDAYELGF